jgi:FixJ family two-component response regulator
MIAIVDDDASVRTALVRVLSAAGHACRGFGSARELLREPWDEQPDCLLLDLQMPEMSGLALSRMLQAAEIHIPTIMMSAMDESRLATDCLEEGAIVCLAKPLDEEVLLATVEMYLSSSNARERPNEV